MTNTVCIHLNLTITNKVHEHKLYNHQLKSQSARIALHLFSS